MAAVPVLRWLVAGGCCRNAQGELLSQLDGSTSKPTGSDGISVSPSFLILRVSHILSRAIKLCRQREREEAERRDLQVCARMPTRSVRVQMCTIH